MKWPGPGQRVILMLVLLGILPFFPGFDDYLISVLVGVLVIGSLGQAWSLMARCGLISLGHAALFGVGAYTTAVAVLAGGPVLFSIILGGLAAVLFSICIVGLTGRLRGAYFALATLVIAAAPKGLILNWESVTGGAVGVFGLPSLSDALLPGTMVDPVRGRLVEYYLLFALVSLVTISGWWMINRTRFGLASAAILQDEVASSVHGVSPFRYKATAIVVSALFSGMIGGFYALQVRYLEPHYIFSLHFSVLPLVVAVFGGLSTVLGPLVGALLLGLADELFFRRFFLTSHDILYGLTLTLTILLFPRGIFSTLIKKKGASFARGE
jgi:branched-chain amino acid transport system permease protein